MKTILKSERILWNGQWQSGAMIIEAGKLTGFTQDPQLLAEAVDYGNQRIIPGIFDTHNHGTHGYGLSGQVSTDPQVQKPIIRHYLKALGSQGVTSIFPTCAVSMIRSVSEVADEDNEGADIVGIHSEGPWLNRVGEKESAPAGRRYRWPRRSRWSPTVRAN